MRHGTKGERFAVRCNVERKPWYIASDSQDIMPRQCLQSRDEQVVLDQR